MKKQIATALALVAIGYGAGTLTPRVDAQVANQDQRVIRAQETQAKALRSIAASLKKMERCR